MIIIKSKVLKNLVFLRGVFQSTTVHKLLKSSVNMLVETNTSAMCFQCKWCSKVLVYKAHKVREEFKGITLVTCSELRNTWEIC